MSSWYSTDPASGNTSNVEVWKEKIQRISCSRCGDFEWPENLMPACPECGTEKLFEDALAEALPKRRLGRSRAHWREVEPNVDTIKVQVTRRRAWWYWHCLPGCLPDSEPFGPFISEKEALCDALRGITKIPIRLCDRDDRDGSVDVFMEFPGAGAVAENDGYISGSSWEIIHENCAWTSIGDWDGLVEELEKENYIVDQSDYTPTIWVERDSLRVIPICNGFALYGDNTSKRVAEEERPVFLCHLGDGTDGVPDIPDFEEQDLMARDQGVVLLPHIDNIEEDPDLIFPDLSVV